MADELTTKDSEINKHKTHFHGISHVICDYQVDLYGSKQDNNIIEKKEPRIKNNMLIIYTLLYTSGRNIHIYQTLMNKTHIADQMHHKVKCSFNLNETLHSYSTQHVLVHQGILY